MSFMYAYIHNPAISLRIWSVMFAERPAKARLLSPLAANPGGTSEWYRRMGSYSFRGSLAWISSRGFSFRSSSARGGYLRLANCGYWRKISLSALVSRSCQKAF